MTLEVRVSTFLILNKNFKGFTKFLRKIKGKFILAENTLERESSFRSKWQELPQNTTNSFRDFRPANNFLANNFNDFNNQNQIFNSGSGYPNSEVEQRGFRHRAGSFSGSEMNLNQRMGPPFLSQSGTGTLGRRKSEVDPLFSPQKLDPAFGRGMMSSASVTDLHLNPMQQVSFNPAIQV